MYLFSACCGLKSESGQTIIEALIALGIAVIIVSSISVAVIASVNNSDYSKDQNLATQYAQQGMDFIRQLSESNWNAFALDEGKTYCLGQDNTLSPSTYSLCNTPNLYNKFFIRSAVIGMDGSCNGIATNVSLIVSWNDGKCTGSGNSYCHKVELDTCMTNLNNGNTVDSTNPTGIIIPTSFPTLITTPTPTTPLNPTSTPTPTPTSTPTPTPVPTSTDYYVSTSGSDSNSGTSALQAFATINHANSVAVPGNTIHVLAGTYDQNVLTTISGTASEPITYVSDTKWGAVIVGAGVSPLLATWENDGNSYINVEGFDVSGGGRFGILNYDGANNINIKQNYVHDVAVGYCNSSGGEGIGSTEAGGPHNNNYIANIVDNVSASTKPCSFVHGFYIQGSNETIQNNLIINNAGLGVACTHACNGPTISNNTILNNGFGIEVGWTSVNSGSTNNAIVTNNIIMNSTGSNDPHAIYEGSSSVIGSNNVFIDNLLFGNIDNDCSLYNGGVCSGTVIANPLFVNYQADGSGDYHLTASSPAINAGTSIGAPSTDFDGTSRPQGNGYDIGAYEYK